MKIVRNDCYGGFGLSPLAIKEYAKLKGFEVFAYRDKSGEFGTYLRLDTEEELRGCFCIYYSTSDWGKECIGRNLNSTFFSERNIERNDPCLVEVVEKLGKKANTSCSELIVVEIPDDVDWEITEYDGWESVEEKHRSW